MNDHSPTIVDQVKGCLCDDYANDHSTFQQAKLVSRELIRVAILWHEMWHEGLEEASRLYFNDKNPEGMIAALAPLHYMLRLVSASISNFALRFFMSGRARKLHERPHSIKYLAEI
jgi:phosphatidylinositol kinase/protein kinase (PI-3  family)